MERTFTAPRPGAVALQLPVGTARVKVDPAAKTATIRLHTRDTEGTSVDAIVNATERAMGGRGLDIDVPMPDGGGMTVVSTGQGGSYSSVSIGSGGGVIVSGGGDFTVNGRRITGGHALQVHGVEADITLPPGADFGFRSISAGLTVTGALKHLAATTQSGDVEAGAVGSVIAQSTSGDVDITAVAGQASINTVSGDIEIGTYSGHSARLNSVSGSVALSATPAAMGQLAATTVSGNIRLRGAIHLRLHTSTVSGRVRT